MLGLDRVDRAGELFEEARAVNDPLLLDYDPVFGDQIAGGNLMAVNVAP